MKPSDSNSLLPYNSYLSKSLCDNLTYGRFLHLKRNSSKTLDYIKGAEKLSQSLLDRGYPERVVQQTRRRANEQRGCELLKEKTLVASAQFTFAIQNTPLANGIKRIIFKYWHLVERFAGSQPRVGFKKTTSIKHKLVKVDSSS